MINRSMHTPINKQDAINAAAAHEFFYNFTMPAEQKTRVMLNDNEQIGEGQLFDLIRQHNNLNVEQGIFVLNVFLLRIAYCFYAEDAGVFEKGQFTSAISSYTQTDASDAANFFTRLFYVLSQPIGSKARNVLQAEYTNFAHIGSPLFSHAVPVPDITADIRSILIDCGAIDWSGIEPSILDLMYQAANYAVAYDYKRSSILD